MQTAHRAYTTLDALCRCMVPAAYSEDPGVDLAAAVADRIATLPPTLQHDIDVALRVFDHRAANLLLDRSTRRFSQLSADAQQLRLLRWERSSLAMQRSVYQALRRLVLSTFYSIPEQLPRVGYRGPLHDREPVVAWEGPVRDGRPRTTADELPVIATTTHDTLGSARVPSGIRADASTAQNGIFPAIEHLHDAVYRADVCIVGSGPGGCVAAARLAEAGVSVIVVEEGGFYGPRDFTDVERDMTPKLYADAGARATDDASVSLLQGRSVGGGGTVNWMLMLRPRPWVMEEWHSAHGVDMLGATELIPALARIEREVEAGYLPEEAHSPSNRIILDGAAALGWTAEPAQINARGCVRAGTCGLGCSHGAKRSAAAVFLPRAIAAGARVLSDVRADRIEPAGAVKRVHCTVMTRSRVNPAAPVEPAAIRVEARVVILAAGAVGTPVLLQKSGIGGDGVGRFLRLHPTTAVRGLYDRVMYGAAGVPQSSLLTQFMHGEDGYGFWIECPPLLPALAAVAVGGFGTTHRQAMLEFPNLAALIVLSRDGADRMRSNGSVLTHRSGRVHIRYRLADADRKLINAGIAAAARLHLAAGAREVTTLHNPAVSIRSERDIDLIGDAPLTPNRISLFSAHVNGTCRMGVDVRNSGCDPDGQRHGHDGIYVADGSLFPTAPGVNPQAAIMAMSSLVAERVAARLRQ